MSKRLKNGIYQARLSDATIRYFVHNGLVVMSSKYGTYKTTESFMLGSQHNVNPDPLPDSIAEGFMDEYNKLEQW
tara:strand:- start:428 stop:652 length:225 start_codon:yes stop_codon:yes gene_type:complete